MLFSYIVGHVPVNFRKKILKNEKVIKKIQKYRCFFYTPFIFTYIIPKAVERLAEYEKA